MLTSEPRNREFILDAKSVLLTYAQCGLERERVRDFLISKGAKYYAIGREEHADGNPHIHAYARWIRRKRISDVRAFDVDGYHPNIIECNNDEASIAYVLKEDDCPLCNLPATRESCYARAVVAKNKEQFFDIIKHGDPRGFCHGLERLEYTARYLFGRTGSEYNGRSRNQFPMIPEFDDWVFAEVIPPQKGNRSGHGGGAPVPSLGPPV